MTEPPEEEAAAPAPLGRRRRPPEELASLPPPRSSLQQRVEDRLRTSKNMRRVHAYTDGGGTVTLSGKVFDDDAKYAAARLAKTVDGVAAVVNNLTTDTSEWAANESRISQDLQGAGLGKVTVKVIGDDAYLDGEVKNETQKQQAVSITESAARVRVRTNLIRVAPSGLFGF
jgi:osmotically-inducible protein OsmY